MFIQIFTVAMTTCMKPLVFVLGQRESAINRATGEANAILAKAKARAEAINLISKALSEKV